MFTYNKKLNKIKYLRKDVCGCDEFDVVEMNVSQYAIKYAELYKQRKKENSSIEHLVRGACKTNLKKTIKKEYKKFLLKRVLGSAGLFVKINFITYLAINSGGHDGDEKLPKSSINDFSLQYFEEKIDINFIYEFAKDLDYSKYFVEKLRRNKGHKIVFEINNLTPSVIEYYLSKMYESSLDYFNELIKPENLVKEDRPTARKKI